MLPSFYGAQMTKRITYTPRKPKDTFRLNSEIHTALSPLLFAELTQLVTNRGPRSRPTIVRQALAMYAHKAHKIKLPDAYQPPQAYHERKAITVYIKPDSLRNEYELHAYQNRLTTSELVMRCIYAYLHMLWETQTNQTQAQNT
jgi:hypothetical protein